MAQGQAILRFLGNKAGLTRGTPQEKALSEMLLEEEVELHNLLVKANYALDKAQAYTDLFATGGAFKTQLAYLEKLHFGESAFFISGEKRCIGGYSLACLLDIASILEPSLLDDYPKMTLFYNTFMALPEFAGAKDMPMYFSRT